MSKNKVLICGYPKVGNTWTRFVIFNYYNILNHGAKKTLSYQQLSDINRHRPEWDCDGRDIGGSVPYKPFVFDEGFPSVYHTHHAYDGSVALGKRSEVGEYFKKFDKLIYVYRNPYDTMISSWHFRMNRNFPFKGIFDDEIIEKFKKLEGFVKYFLPIYLHHIKVTKPHADLVLDYDYLRKQPEAFYHALVLIVGLKDFKPKILQKAIEMSSFGNIKKMGIESNQKHGMAGAYRGHFTRDGKSGQYLSVMSKELIEWIRNEFKKNDLKI